MKANKAAAMQFDYYPGEITVSLCGYIGETDTAVIDHIDSALYQLKAICENPYNSDCYTDLYRALERFTEKWSRHGGRKAVNIQWDVDDPEDLELLPTEIDIPDEMTDIEEISDYITEQTGFCHKGFTMED